MPDGMRDEIKLSADLNGRSMNAEIVQRLKQSYSHYEDDRLKLDIPAEVRHALLVDALAHGKTEDERAAEILAGAYDPEGDYTELLDRLAEEVEKTSDIEERYDALKKVLERDFVLYYGKAIQLSQFVRMVLDTAGGVLPDSVREAAEELEHLTETELSLLRQRYEDGLFWVKRRDIESENARDAANEGEDG